MKAVIIRQNFFKNRQEAAASPPFPCSALATLLAYALNLAEHTLTLISGKNNRMSPSSGLFSACVSAGFLEYIIFIDWNHCLSSQD